MSFEDEEEEGKRMLLPAVNFRADVRSAAYNLGRGVEWTATKRRQQTSVVKNIRQTEIGNLHTKTQQIQN